MARLPRLTVPGYPHHIILRGPTLLIHIDGSQPPSSFPANVIPAELADSESFAQRDGFIMGEEPGITDLTFELSPYSAPLRDFHQETFEEACRVYANASPLDKEVMRAIFPDKIAKMERWLAEQNPEREIIIQIGIKLDTRNLVWPDPVTFALNALAGWVKAMQREVSDPLLTAKHSQFALAFLESIVPFVHQSGATIDDLGGDYAQLVEGLEDYLAAERSKANA